MKTVKKSKRTNWKQRALHCEEVIGVQNALAKDREARLNLTKMAFEEMRKQSLAFCANAESAQSAATSWENRALAAEKHNALLLEERKRTKPKDYEWAFEAMGSSLPRTANSPVIYVGEKPDPKDDPKPAPTHWQRFKSFLKHWYVELLCLIVILCVTAGCVAFVYWPRG